MIGRAKKLLQSLPWQSEFAFVLVSAFGLFVFSSVRSVLFPVINGTQTQGDLLDLVVLEVGIGVVLGLILAFRGWTLPQLGLKPHWMDAIAGVGLMVAGYLGFYLLWVLVAVMAPDIARNMAATKVVSGHISISTIAAVVVVNPLFEEIFVCGYLVSVLKPRFGEWTAVNVSVALRLVYHLYQGALGVVGEIPLGLVFAFYFARTSKLWPVIIAHALIDCLGLLAAT